MDIINEWTELLGNFGFPILVAVYLLFRFEQRIDKLTNVIIELKNTLEHIKNQSGLNKLVCTYIGGLDSLFSLFKSLRFSKDRTIPLKDASGSKLL